MSFCITYRHIKFQCKSVDIEIANYLSLNNEKNYPIVSYFLLFIQPKKIFDVKAIFEFKDTLVTHSYSTAVALCVFYQRVTASNNRGANEKLDSIGAFDRGTRGNCSVQT